MAMWEVAKGKISVLLFTSWYRKSQNLMVQWNSQEVIHSVLIFDIFQSFYWFLSYIFDKFLPLDNCFKQCFKSFLVGSSVLNVSNDFKHNVGLFLVRLVS